MGAGARAEGATVGGASTLRALVPGITTDSTGDAMSGVTVTGTAATVGIGTDQPGRTRDKTGRSSRPVMVRVHRRWRAAAEVRRRNARCVAVAAVRRRVAF